MQTVFIISATVSTILDASQGNSMANKVQIRYAVIQDKEVDYRKISEIEIPDPIFEILSRAFPGFMVESALRGDNGIYKFVVRNGRFRIKVIMNKSGAILNAGKLLTKR